MYIISNKKLTIIMLKILLLFTHIWIDSMLLMSDSRRIIFKNYYEEALEELDN